MSRKKLRQEWPKRPVPPAPVTPGARTPFLVPPTSPRPPARRTDAASSASRPLDVPPCHRLVPPPSRMFASPAHAARAAPVHSRCCVSCSIGSPGRCPYYTACAGERHFPSAPPHAPAIGLRFFEFGVRPFFPNRTTGQVWGSEILAKNRTEPDIGNTTAAAAATAAAARAGRCEVTAPESGWRG
ncbi:hypothetical protein DFH08DRAFT_1088640 [Mycena albidolilacea]|uniref:Uncharacterized protein n=1 Tax=Mycena albidolilacea TaxID=1033008 RepID=A0AAD6Z4J3_9AGAR|nr:hypothetical protein DFH08DRAFT_1088640 [Mycena albidolilacea]